MADPFLPINACFSATTTETLVLKEELLPSHRNVEWLIGQVDKSVPAFNTPAEKYLRDHRGIFGPYPKSVRYLATYQIRADAKYRSCLLAVATNEKGETVGLQSTEINIETGVKARASKPDKFSCGKIADAAVYLGNEDLSPTMVIGEGIETTLTRNLVSACDSYACLGTLRYLKPKKHHKRIEILADNGNRDAARRLARKYAESGYSAYVVTVPESLGPKADLNDLLIQLGLSAVATAVEDAEQSTKASLAGLINFSLTIGSDVEIAQKILEQLEEIYGPLVFCDGHFWRFDRTHWVAFDNDSLARFIHRADGAKYEDAAANTRTIRLNKSRVASILDAATKYRHEREFFEDTPIGVNCESGFILIDANGSIQHFPHARRWKQRHVVRGNWKGQEQPLNWAKSYLATYLRDAFRDDDDAEEKIRLLAEVTGCAATAQGTRLRNPKAIVAYSTKGGTGKSTFLKILRAMPSPNAVVSVPAAKFSDEKYTHRLIGKVLNASDELPDRAIKSDVFKRIITGEPVPARDVYASAIDFSPIAQHVFSTNVLPAFSGGVDGGTARRLLPIEFSHVVPEGKRDPDLAYRITTEESDLLLHFAVEGACRLGKQRDFTVPTSSQRLLNDWLLDVDPVRAWAAECLEITPFENVMPGSALYSSFLVWADRQSLRKEFLPNPISLGRRLPAVLPGLETYRSNGTHYLNVQFKAHK